MIDSPTNSPSRQLESDPGRRNGILVRVWRRRSIALAIFCAVFSLAVIALIVLPVNYLAVGSVIVAEPEPGVANASAAWSQKIGDPADMESQLLVIRSPRVLRLMATEPDTIEVVLRECRYTADHRRLGWLFPWMGMSCEKLKADSDELIDYLQARFLVGSAGRSRVINIAYKSMMPDVAQSMVNILVTAFLDDQRINLSKGREVAAAWLWEELRRLDAEIHDADAKIQAYRSAKGLMRGANAPINSERLTSTSQQLAAAEAVRAEAAAKLDEIRADQNRGSSNASAVLASRAISDLKQQITAVSGQLNIASTVFGPKHPSYIALKRELEGLQDRFAAEVSGIAANAEKAYNATEAVVESLRRQLEMVKSQVTTASADEASIESMVRSVETKRAQYSDVHKRASELETERRVLLGSTRLVNLAEKPNTPFFPKRMPFLVGGFTLGIMLAFIAALLRDRVDRSVRSSIELAAASGTSTLAEIPEVGGGRSSVLRRMFFRRTETPSLKAALDAAKHDTRLQNSLRKLYAGLLFATGIRKCSTLLVASAGKAEGKTFLSFTLAQFAATSGRRVLVVECDARNPVLQSALNLKSDRGLMDVLRGTATLRDALTPQVGPNLDLLSAGHSDTEPVELFMENLKSELLRWTQSYDLVILDSPPSNNLMDACMLAKHVDGVLWCARWGISSLSDSVAALDTIRSAGGRIVGTVITMFTPNEYSLYEPTKAPPMVRQAYLKAS